MLRKTIMLIFILLSVSRVYSFDIIFDTRLDYSVGNIPNSVFCSDLNGDGHLDLAVTNEVSDDVCVLINDGNGFFPERSNYDVGDTPKCVFVADLDEDGDGDLTIANSFSNEITLIFNQGDGTFGRKWFIPVGDDPRSLCVSDLDGDGDNDIAVALYSPDSVEVLLNSGNAVFDPPVSYPAGEQPQHIIACDLDGDQNQDLVVANRLSNTVSLLFNNGDGSFQPAVDYGVGEWPWSVFSADFDGDGDYDLATANEYSDDVTVLFNNGAGTFTEPVSYYLGWRVYPLAISSADLDHDNDWDLAVATRYCWLFTLSNNGDGTFQVSEYHQDLSGRYSIFLADLDQDGDQDLATCGGWHAGVLFNDGTGAFHSTPALTMDEPQGVCVVDLDGDQDYDLVVAEYHLDSILTFFNNGNGSFQRQGSYAVGEKPGHVVSVDLDGDLDKDLLVTNQEYDSISVLLNNGDGTFQPRTDFGAPSELSYICSARLDLDSDNDVALTYTTYAGSATYGHVATKPNGGNGVLGPTITWASFGPHTTGGNVLAKDVDGDQDNDLIVACGGLEPKIVVLTNTGNGGFFIHSEHLLPDGASEAGKVAAADFNADGHVDLAVPYFSYPNYFIRIYLNDGEGGFVEDADYDARRGMLTVLAFDADGDGDTDIGGTNQYYSMTLLLNDGNGNFSSQAPFDYGAGWYAAWLTGADLDNDGDFDLVTSNCYSSDVSILFNLTNTSFLQGDANGDGNIDPGDVVHLITYLYRGGPPPQPLERGDANCDGEVNAQDVIYLINYLFRGGEPPPC